MGKHKVCIHNRRQYQCKPCHGAGICEHKRMRSQCKDCKGASICEHNRLRDHWKDCQGNGVCEHNRQRRTCKNCQGSRICEHDRQRHQCKECIPWKERITRSNWCTGCGEKHAKKKNDHLCASCRPVARRAKRTQLVVWDAIKGRLPTISSPGVFVGTSKTDKQKCAVTHKRQPDYSWVGTDRVVTLEIDEHSHASREVSCELAKLDETRHAAEGGEKAVVTIRYNPDTYTRRKLSTAERLDTLVDIIKTYLECPVENFGKHGANVVYVFYHTTGQKHINAAKEKCDSITVLAVVE